MKCINKTILSVAALAALILFAAGCGAGSEPVNDAYPEFSGAYYGFRSAAGGSGEKTFTSDLCVIGTENTDVSGTHAEISGGAGLFDMSTTDVRYAYNVHNRLFPASTTKVLTLYIAVTMGNPDDIVTVSEHAVDQPSDSSTCDLMAGDQISLRELCYGMMLRSGNDAAIAIAEHIGGSEEGFAAIMNSVANSLGATNSHFVNPNGLPNDDHYTTVYDMYLIMNQAVKDPSFTEIITTDVHETNYLHADGTTVSKEWKTTNPYLNGKEAAPEGVVVLGGKTGTTQAAGYCLINLIQNMAGDLEVSTVFHADGRSNLYLLMNEMMGGYAN